MTQAQKPWAKLLEKMTKAKQEYHAACKNERSAINQERNASGDTSLSPDQVKKLQERVIKCKEEVSKCREKYDSSLRELTDYNQKYQEDMTDVFEKCQEFEDKRLKFFRDILLTIHSCLDISSDATLPAIYQEMKQVISASDSDKDLKWWSTNHGTGMPTNWPVFEEYTPDLHNISKKERKIVSQIVHQDSVTLTHVNHTSSSSGLTGGFVSNKFDSNGSSSYTSGGPTASSGYSSSSVTPANPSSSMHHHHSHVVPAAPASSSLHNHSSSHHGIQHSMSGPGSSSASSSSASSTCHGPTTIVKNNGNLVHSSAPGKSGVNGSSLHHHHQNNVKTVSINENSNKKYASGHNHTVVIEGNGKSHHHRRNNGSTSSHEANPFDEDHCDTDWDDYPKDALIDTGEPGVPVRALYDYEGAEADELSFKLGDEFEKLEDEDEQGWCKGRKDGRVGLYPANYVEPIPLPLPVK